MLECSLHCEVFIGKIISTVMFKGLLEMIRNEVRLLYGAPMASQEREIAHKP